MLLTNNQQLALEDLINIVCLCLLIRPAEAVQERCPKRLAIDITLKTFESLIGSWNSLWVLLPHEFGLKLEHCSVNNEFWWLCLLQNHGLNCVELVFLFLLRWRCRNGEWYSGRIKYSPARLGCCSVGLEHWKCLLRGPRVFCIIDNPGNKVASRKAWRL